jgi:hypothetical protein
MITCYVEIKNLVEKLLYIKAIKNKVLRECLYFAETSVSRLRESLIDPSDDLIGNHT